MTSFVSQKQHKVYEDLVSHIYQVELSKGDGFLDVGANIGHHTWRMGEAVGPSGFGYAIEALPHLKRKIEKVLWIKGISWVTVIQGIVSDKKGLVTFYFRPLHDGWSSLYEEHVHPDDQGVDRELLELESFKIDDLLLHEIETLSVIKLDVENAEFRAMRGARKLIAKTRPIILFENLIFQAPVLSQYSLEDFFIFFNDLDYKLFDIYGTPFSQETIQTASEEELHVYFLAMPSEHTGSKDPDCYYQLTKTVNFLLSNI